MSAQAVRSWLIEDLKNGVYEMHILFDSVMSVSTVDAAKIEVSPDAGVTPYNVTTAVMISTSNSKYLKFSVDAAFRNGVQAEGDADKGVMEIELAAGAFKDNAEENCGATAYTDNIRCHVISLDISTTLDYEPIDAISLIQNIFLPRETIFTMSDNYNAANTTKKARIYGGGIADTEEEYSTNNTSVLSGDLKIYPDAANADDLSADITIDIEVYNLNIGGDCLIGKVHSTTTETGSTFTNGSDTITGFTGMTINEYQNMYVCKATAYPSAIQKISANDATTITLDSVYTGTTGASAAYIVSYYEDFIDYKIVNCLINGDVKIYCHETTKGMGLFNRCTVCGTIYPYISINSGIILPYYNKKRISNSVIRTVSGESTGIYTELDTITINSHSSGTFSNIQFVLNITGSTDSDIKNNDEYGIVGYTLTELQQGTSWSSGDKIIVGREYNNDAEIIIGIPKGDFCPIGAFQNAVTLNLTITGAVLSGSDKIVTLATTETLTAGDTYRVIVNNVQDTDGNIIESGTTEIFEAT